MRGLRVLVKQRDAFATDLVGGQKGVVDASARRTHDAILALPAERREGVVAEMRLIVLPAAVPPWTATGIHLRRDEWFSVLASGRVILAAALDLSFAPSLALWGRIGGRAPLLNGTRDTASFRSLDDGALELAIYNGEWATPDGVLATPVEAYAASTGAIEVLVVRWRGEPLAGLGALAELLPDDALLAGELDRLRHALPPPDGWRPLWFLGATECFHDRHEHGRPAIQIDTRDTVGIVQKPIEFPLGPDTRLTWRWRVDELPAVAAEDSPIAHDYVSLALEFEDGQDLTWYWSGALPVGTHYRCPLPNWTSRETHWVLRSGTTGLGEWQQEERRVATDYRAAAVGAELPTRIVAAWLIAVSIFGHRRGRAVVADVVLHGPGGRTLRVL